MKRQIVLEPGTKLLRLGGRPPTVVLWLLVEQIAAFVAYAFADGPAWVSQWLGSSGGQVVGKYYLWQPLTALWLHLPSGVQPGLGIQNLLFDTVTLWLFGAALERWWGSRRFLLFWVVTGGAGLVVGTLFGALQPAWVLSGSMGAAAAMMVAIALIFPMHLLQVSAKGVLPLKARVVALVLAGIMLLGSLISARFLEVAVQLTGAAVALLFVLNPRRILAEARVKQAKKKFGVIEGGKKKRGGGKDWVN